MSNPNDLSTDDTGRETSDQSPEAAVVARLHEQIRGLKATVQDLRRSADTIETQLREVTAENYRLRREMTLSALIEDLAAAEKAAAVPDERTRRPPCAVEELFAALPARFRFSVFFRRAEEKGLGTEQARRALLRRLTTGRLVQSGAYLEKTEPDR
jgi:hypothetical protein